MDPNKLSYQTDNVLGSTSASINHIAEAEQCLIYVASAQIVFYNPLIDQQVAYIAHSSPHISTIATQQSSKLLAVADKGKNPNISIYSIEKIQKFNTEMQKPIFELKGHKHTIDILCFSPLKKYLLSISNHDGSMFLWQNGECLTKNKLNKAITKAAFHESGDLITIGRGYFKVWKFNNGVVIRKKEDDCWMMQGKVLTFGKNFSTKDFIDIGFYKIEKTPDTKNDKILLFSSDGLLCIMQSNYEKIQKWIDLSMQKCTSLELIGNLALLTGDNALVKVVQLNSLTLQNKFPKPPPTNKENLSKDEPLQYSQNEEFPQCLGVKKIGDYIATIYSNKTIFIWQLQEQAAAIRSIITHRGRISSVSLLQEIKGDITFFSTVCQDRTCKISYDVVRLWHFYKKQFSGNRGSIDIAEIIGIKRNVYCKNLTRIIYTESEMPIYRIKMYEKDSIACISQQEFLLYSLHNFQLLLYHSFEEEFNKKIILSIEVYQNLIYLGNEAGQIRVYRPQQEKLIKMKEIDMEMPIQFLQIFNKKILAYGKGRLKCIGLEGQTILNQYNIECCIGSGNYIVICEKKVITFYNLIKLRKTATINIAHELDQHEYIKLVRSNSWLIVLLTNKNKIIVTNFSSIILFIEQNRQNINDFAVTEGGEIIIVTEGGTIIIKNQENKNKVGWMDQKVKKWFEQNDMSWMDGSVWVSKSKSISQPSNKQSFQLDSIDCQNSIKLGQSYEPMNQSIGFQHQLPNVTLQYNNEQNKRSIFNPSSIGIQLNKIYNNVNEIMKNRKPPLINNIKKDQTQKVDEIEEITIQNKTKSQKRRIFGEQSEHPMEYMPTFSNNLVQSVISKGKSPSSMKNRQNQGVSTEDNDKVKNSPGQSFINFGFSNFFQEKQSKKSVKMNPYNERLNYTQSLGHEQLKTQEQNQEFTRSIQYLLKNKEQLLKNRQQRNKVILQHGQKYAQVYQILSLAFDEAQQTKYKKKIIKQFEQLSKEFISKINQ